MTALLRNRRAAWIAAFLVAAFLAILSLSAAGHGRRASHTAATATAESAEVLRGKYLVEEVAKCSECHTPRDSAGELQQDAWLRGAPIWIRPVAPIVNWADRAPALAGLPSFTDEQMERILEKGTGPEGEVLRPPMHTYHMVPADAQAIIAYLKSLPREKH